MTQNKQATWSARRAIMQEMSDYGKAQGLHDGGASTWFGGWKDYYFRAPANAPLPCQRCATQAIFRYGDLRRENRIKANSAD